MDNVVSRMVEYIAGMELFKAYNLTGERFKRLKDSFNDLKRESINTEIANLQAESDRLAIVVKTTYENMNYYQSMANSASSE